MRNSEKHLMMQKVHLVVTYEDGNTWKLFMPDCVRTILRDTTESQIGEIRFDWSFLLIQQETVVHRRSFPSVHLN